MIWIPCRDRISQRVERCRCVGVNRWCATNLSPCQCLAVDIERVKRLAECRGLVHVRQIDRDNVAARQPARISHRHRQVKRRICLEVELARINNRDHACRTDCEGPRAAATRDGKRMDTASPQAERQGVPGIYVARQHRTDGRAVCRVFWNRERLSGNRRSFVDVGQIDRDRVARRQTTCIGDLHRQVERRSRLEVELARIGDRDHPCRTDREGTQAVATRDAERLRIPGIHVAGQHRTNRRSVRSVFRN